MDITEPKIERDDILIVKDSDFNPDSVCIVTGCWNGDRQGSVSGCSRQQSDGRQGWTSTKMKAKRPRRWHGKPAAR